MEQYHQLSFANDEMAIGGMRALSEENINIPNEVSIIGFDDILLSQYVTPALTTIRQPNYRAGQLSAQLIFDTLQGKKDVQHFYTLDTTLVERDTCQKLHTLYS